MNFAELKSRSTLAPDSSIVRDIRVNLERLVNGSALSPEEGALAVLACATSVGDLELRDLAAATLKNLDFPQDQIAEASQVAAVMAMLNTYYRFKHFATHGDPQASERYPQAGLRMTALAKPSLGKARFEMLAFAVSVLNGCETCVTSHEKTLLGADVESAKIHDLARLASAVKAWSALSNAL